MKRETVKWRLHLMWVWLIRRTILLPVRYEDLYTWDLFVVPMNKDAETSSYQREITYGTQNIKLVGRYCFQKTGEVVDLFEETEGGMHKTHLSTNHVLYDFTKDTVVYVMRKVSWTYLWKRRFKKPKDSCVLELTVSMPPIQTALSFPRIGILRIKGSEIDVLEARSIQSDPEHLIRMIERSLSKELMNIYILGKKLRPELRKNIIIEKVEEKWAKEKYEGNLDNPFASTVEDPLFKETDEIKS